MAKPPRHVLSAADRAEARAQGRDPFAEPEQPARVKRARRGKPDAAEPVEPAGPKGPLPEGAEEAAEALVEGAYELQPHTIKVGRPAKYRPDMATQAAAACELGATDAQLASILGVSTVTIWRWQAEHPEFCNALKVGKEVADAKVERALYQRAVGYAFDAQKITNPARGTPKVVNYVEHVQPDVSAAIFWLKNRQRDKWRDKTEHEHSGALDINAVWAQMGELGKTRARALEAPQPEAAPA